MTTNSFAPKQPWVAGVLTLCCPGLGHLYVGRLTRGLLLFLVSLILVPAAALLAGLTSSTTALAGLMAACVALLVLWCVAAFDASRIARHGGSFEQHEYQRPLVYALFLAAGICSPMISAAYLRRSVLEAFYLPSKSMAPTLQQGDRILVNKTSWRLEHVGRGDVVVFRPPEQRHLIFIKRLVGLPGDEVTIESGELRINGVQIVPREEAGTQEEAATKAGDAMDNSNGDSTPQSRKQTVPPGMCFLVGDNLNNSFDSRKFGPVPLGDIIGVAEYIYLPGNDWSRFGKFQ